MNQYGMQASIRSRSRVNASSQQQRSHLAVSQTALSLEETSAKQQNKSVINLPDAVAVQA